LCGLFPCWRGFATFIAAIFGNGFRSLVRVVRLRAAEGRSNTVIARLHNGAAWFGTSIRLSSKSTLRNKSGFSNFAIEIGAVKLVTTHLLVSSSGAEFVLEQVALRAFPALTGRGRFTVTQ
jgi:hypothetical protein